LSSEDELRGAIDDISDGKSYTDFSKLAGCYQEEKKVAFLELDFPFQQGKWILVAFTTKKMKKLCIGVTMSVRENQQ
jgi:hypothetical protein